MEQPSADSFFAPQCRAGAVYKAIIRRNESPRDIDDRVFAQITAAMQAATAPNAHFNARIEAAHRNRELWQALACDLVGEHNALPEDLRASLISPAIWVTGETSRVMQGRGPVQPPIDVNSGIMQGPQDAAKKVV